MARPWDHVLSDRDRAVFEAAGFGRAIGFGQRAALLIIDVHYNFVGDAPEPILDSIRKYRTSCGEAGWAAVGHIQKVLQAARKKHLPTFYTVSERRPDFQDTGRVQHLKNSRASEATSATGTRGTEIVAEVAPIPEDILVSKRKPSPFFGTPLVSYLIDRKVDTLIVTGCTTSGCVRAAVIDAYAYNFRAIVPEECVFDRGELSHAVNLWDMNAKYADVVPTRTVLDYLEQADDRADWRV